MHENISHIFDKWTTTSARWNQFIAQLLIPVFRDHEQQLFHPSPPPPAPPSFLPTNARLQKDTRLVLKKDGINEPNSPSNENTLSMDLTTLHLDLDQHDHFSWPQTTLAVSLKPTLSISVGSLTRGSHANSRQSCSIEPREITNPGHTRDSSHENRHEN